MFISLIVYAIPYIMGIVLLAAVIGGYSNFRRSRKAPYFRLRSDANRRAWQWVLIFLAASVMLGGALYARRFVPEFNLAELQPPTPEPEFLATPEIGVPDGGGETVLPALPTASLPPTITPTQNVTPTVSPTPIIATIESDVSVPEEATLIVTEISSGISPQLTAVNANTTFPVGTTRIYFWFAFTGMADGASWSQVLLLNGNVVRSESEAWNNADEGTAYYWFEAQGGWPGGSYEIQFYLGDTLADSANFQIID